MSQFKNGIFGCFNDCGTCVITFFVPCYTAGKVAEGVGKSCILCGLLNCFEPCGMIGRTIVRGAVREKQGIEGSTVMDFVCHCFCPCCALVQEHQELYGGGGEAGKEMARE